MLLSTSLLLLQCIRVFSALVKLKHLRSFSLKLLISAHCYVTYFCLFSWLQVEDATKALEATNGTTLEKNGQILRVAYAKSILGPGSGASGTSQSSSLAAAAIEAATFAQQVCFLAFHVDQEATVSHNMQILHSRVNYLNYVICISSIEFLFQFIRG